MNKPKAVVRRRVILRQDRMRGRFYRRLTLHKSKRASMHFSLQHWNGYNFFKECEIPAFQNVLSAFTKQYEHFYYFYETFKGILGMRFKGKGACHHINLEKLESTTTLLYSYDVLICIILVSCLPLHFFLFPLQFEKMCQKERSWQQYLRRIRM